MPKEDLLMGSGVQLVLIHEKKPEVENLTVL
jgi:hypothetical protein